MATAVWAVAMSDDTPKFSDLKGSILKFFKQVSVPSPHKEAGGQEIKIDSLPGIAGEQKPTAPEVEDVQIPDISSAIRLPENTNPDVEYLNVCAQCGQELCSYPDRKLIPIRRR